MGHQSPKCWWLLFALIILGLTLFPYLRLRAAMKTAPGFQNPTRYDFSSDGLHAVNDVSSADVKWSGFYRILETRTTFILLRSQNFATYVPKRCFRTTREIVLLRQLIMENFKGKWRLRREQNPTATSSP
jgi:hypothetical protein